MLKVLKSRINKPEENECGKDKNFKLSFPQPDSLAPTSQSLQYEDSDPQSCRSDSTSLTSSSLEGSPVPNSPKMIDSNKLLFPKMESNGKFIHKKRKDEEHQMSEYERRRAINIERNNARLFKLGLLSKEEMKNSNDHAWGIKSNEKKNKAGHKSIRVRDEKGRFLQNTSTDSNSGPRTRRLVKGNKQNQSTDGVRRKGKFRLAKAKKAMEGDGIWV